MSTKTTAYGSITIVDITDIGEFSVQPESNMPLSVIYDPDNNTYTPSWSSNDLRITPVVYYAGKQLDPSNTNGLDITWKRKDGASQEVSADHMDETYSAGSLMVTSDSLWGPEYCSSGLLTYICTATYIEPDSGIELTAKGQITFALVKNAPKVKKCSITGENVFKYNTSGVLQGEEYITLTGTVSNVSIAQWQYKNSEGTWTNYPVTSGNNTSNISNTLKVYADKESNVFVNDIATIRLNTSDSTVYDIHTITKLRDGAAGSSTVAAVLTNDDQWIACDSDGNPLNGAFDQAFSKITILEGGVDVTSDWTIQCETDGVTGEYNNDTYTYTVTSISKNSANVQFECTRNSYTTIYKNFSLTKLTAAKDGTSPTIHSVEPDTYIVNRTIEGVHSPNKVTFKAYSKTGNEEKVSYSGRFLIYNDETLVATTGDGQSSYEYTFVNGSTVKSVRCELYQKGGGGNPLDTQTIVVTSDGATGANGAQGEKGEAATNVVLGNQADIIPCNSDGSVKSAMTLTIPFTGYLGTSKADCTVAVSGLPSGIAIKTNTGGTTSTNGKLELSVTSGSTLGGVNSGTITLTFACNETTILHYYQWSKSIQALDGNNAILFEIYAPTGNIISNGENSVTLQARLMDGSTESTSSATYVWKKYEKGTYTAVSGATSSSLTVEPSSVSGYASYQCIATYNTKEYTAYYAVIDKTDPIQAHVYSSIGTQILNGKGCGAVYVKIFRNGQEIDPIKSEVFSETAPTNPKTGDFYYRLDAATNTVTLMKYNGSAWDVATGSDLPTATYTYTFRAQNGDITTYNGQPSVTGKVLYIDGELINKKIIIDVAVTV